MLNSNNIVNKMKKIIKNQKSKIGKYFLVGFTVAMIYTSCRDNQWDNRLSGNEFDVSLLDAIEANPLCSRFHEAVVIAGYSDLLSQDNNFTVFVPSNDAWQTVDMNNVAAVRAIVAYHIAYGMFLSTNPALREPLQMSNTKVVNYNSETQTFNGAKITSADHVAGNGVFHITDGLMIMQNNIWEVISAMTELQQIQFIYSLNQEVMDMERSVQTGVNRLGRPVYDTIWMNVNNFLKQIPLYDEKEELTYIVLKNEGFDRLFDKYRSCFRGSTDMATDSLTRFHIAQDFTFRGRIDIAQYDTIVNIFGVKVPVKDAIIEESFEASNGIVYVIDQSNVLLKEKFKPTLIEGEDYLRADNSSFVFVRFKRWASGERDMFLSSSNRQTNTFHTIGTFGQDSIYTRASKLFQVTSEEHGGNIRANIQNFWIEYKSYVFSLDYEIHYVAYDDVLDHYDINEPPLRLYQKLFVSMPDRPTLRKATNNQIINNYLGDDICFVSQDTAGIHKERIMRQWSLDITANRPQLILEPINSPTANILRVDRVGELTMWLCNTALSTTGSEQGMLFLDYIKLVPKLPEED